MNIASKKATSFTTAGGNILRIELELSTIDFIHAYSIRNGWPGKYEASAGGSALKGETPIQGAIRKLREETGIVTNDLKQIYHTISEWQHSIYYGYLCLTDCEKDSISLQKGEPYHING